MILLDSTYFIDLLRARQDPRRMLAPYLKAGWLHTCELIRMEVLRGIVSVPFRRELESFFDLIPDQPLTAVVWRRALDLGWMLDRKGDVLPLTDLLIGACALEHGAAVVSSDNHFARIPGLKLRKSLPPPGRF